MGLFVLVQLFLIMALQLPISLTPEHGLGRLSSSLHIADWVDFQNAQRAHLNYLETLSLTQSALAVSGYFYPKPASILALIHLLGRQIYCSSFRSSPSKRATGFVILSLTNLAMFGLGVAGAIQMIRSNK